MKLIKAILLLLIILGTNYGIAQDLELESRIISLEDLKSNSWVQEYIGLGIKSDCSYADNILTLKFRGLENLYHSKIPFYLSMTKDSVFNWDKINSSKGMYVVYFHESLKIDEVYGIKGTDEFILRNEDTETRRLHEDSLEYNNNVISIDDLFKVLFWRIDNIKLSKIRYKIKFTNHNISIARYKKESVNTFLGSSYLFYLSSTPDAKFDLSKMNNREGSYLIICNKDNSTTVAEVEKINDKRINLIFNKSFVVELSQIADRRKRKNRK